MSNQAGADDDAHKKTVGKANVGAAEINAALRKEAVEPPPSKRGLRDESVTDNKAWDDKVDAWIAFCDRNKADGKEPEGKAADDKVLSDCFSALRDEESKECATKVSLSCQAALGEDKGRATMVSMSCQTALGEEESEESAEAHSVSKSSG